MENANEPITVIVTRLVREGSESAFEGAVREFIPKAIAFPGHLGGAHFAPCAGRASLRRGVEIPFAARLDCIPAIARVYVISHGDRTAH